MSPAPTILTFLRTFRDHWFAAASGGVSVPFAALAAYLDSLPAKVIFTVLAIAAAGFAAYRVWGIERAALIKAEAEVKTLRDAADRRATGQRILGEIGKLRTQLSALRIEMEEPQADRTSAAAWDDRLMTIDGEIVQKIAELAGPGEAEIYRIRGNIPRHVEVGPRTRARPPPHQLTIDLCIYDLDRLAEFIRNYSGRFVP